MKKFVKTLPKRHPLSVEIRELHGAEGFTYLTDLLDLAQEIGFFELTPKIVSRECGINAQKVARIFENLKRIFEESCEFLELSSNKVPTKLKESSKKVETLGGQNPRGSTRDQEKNREEKKEENTPPTPQVASGFEEFWSLYPKKLEKGKVKEYWTRHKLDSKLPEILQGLSAWKKTDNWARDGGQYIPYPIRFLKNERWKDEIDSSGPVSAGVKLEKVGTLADRLMQHERIVDMFNPSDVLETSKLRNDGHGQLWNGNTPIAVEQYKPL